MERRRGLVLACALIARAAAAAALHLDAAAALHVRAPRVMGRHRWRAAPQCCICINCKWVDRCKTYHWVEEMHEQPHVTEAPDFDPNDPQIQVYSRIAS